MTARAATATQGEPILLREDRGGVTTLTLNRPRQYNALSEAMLTAVQEALDRIGRDDSVRVLVLAGRGKAFCAGHDLKEMRGKPDEAYYHALFKQCSRMMLSLRRLPQPVIARVHGLATAAGCQLVATADLAVASSAARFATSGIGVGLFCMTPGVALSRNVSLKHAFEMLFTGEFISADQAAEIGLVNRVAAPAHLDESVAELADAIVAKSQACIAAGKRVLYKQIEMGLAAAYDYASKEMASNMMFEDAGEGIDAFIAKRKPVWRDR
ncbi:MAG: enoyl-CoA hydratase [Kiloniellaceae bacterium]